MTGRDLAAELRQARETYGVDSPEARAAFAARLAEVAAQEAGQPEQWWWLSFADATDGHNLGCAIVLGSGMIGAVQRTKDLDINPGGAVQGAPVGEIIDVDWTRQWTDRLLTPDEARSLPAPFAVIDYTDGA